MGDIPLTPEAEITEDVQCIHCGYNLRGLTRDGVCPECGTPIARSVHGNQLRYADPDWLETLRFGTSLKLWNIVVALFVGIGAAAVIRMGLPPFLTTLSALAGAGLGLWAAFLITVPEPRVAMQEDPITLRKVVRACAALAFGGQLLSQAGQYSAGDVMLVLAIAGGACSLAGIVGYFGELVYYRRFARRIPDPKLEKSTTTVLWGLPIAWGALLIGSLIIGASAYFAAAGSGPGAPAGTGPTPGALVGGGAFLCVGGVATLVFALWYIRLLTSYKKAFRAAAAQAGQASGSGPT